MTYGIIPKNTMMEMEQKLLSKEDNNTTKYILPIINSRLKYNITSEDIGFINAYTYDVNRPQHGGKVHLVYEYVKLYTKNTWKDIVNSPGYQTKYTLRIDDKCYQVFIFIVPRSIIGDFKKIQGGNLTTISPFTKQDIIEFWNGSPKQYQIIKNLIYQYDISPFEDAIPEEDYHESVLKED